jgi:vitamin K-dependent gamma-carboxylase-like protein
MITATAPLARLARRIDGWFYAPLPRERLALLRILIGAYALIYLVSRAAHLNQVTGYAANAFAPVGPVSLLSQPLPATWVYAIYGATVLTGIAFVTGFLYRALAPVFALLLLWVTSYRHSWGMIFHTDNLMVLHVLVLALAPAADAFRVRRGPRPSPASAEDTVHGRYGWAVRTIGLVTLATYVAAGIAKLENTGFGWAFGDALREQIAYDAVRKIELGSVYSPLAAWMVRQAWLFPVFALFTLAVEFLAPLALLGTRWAIGWCTAAWLFHVGVLASMAIVFPYPLSGCAFLSLFPLERWRSAAWLRWLAARLPRPGGGQTVNEERA